MTDQPLANMDASAFQQMVHTHLQTDQPPLDEQTEVIDDRFLQNSVKPIPIFAPMPQTAMNHYKDKEQKPNVPFNPDVRQLLVSMLFHMIKIPVRELQVLAYHEEAAVIFFLPHGFTSYRELAPKRPDIFDEIGLLREEIASIRTLQLQTLEEIQQANARQRRIMEQLAERERQAQLERQRTLERRRRIDLDPIIPLSTINLGANYNHIMRQIILDLIYWQEDYSLQEHQAWGERVTTLLSLAQSALTNSRQLLTDGEYEFMQHFLNLSVANPAIWKPNGIV